MPEFDDDFSNNLFSDLAPLLTLFGEQVTIQFLSMSMGWADNILLAMGPLGVITIVVSAIRVAGDKRLKALIGRARESHSVAEQELLSSTSEDVCEMWSGQQIVRLIGDSQETQILVALEDGKVCDIATANRLLFFRDEKGGDIFGDIPSGLCDIINDNAPSLTLNVPQAVTPRWELWSWTALSILLQSVAVLFPALITFWWKWNIDDSPPDAYGYPCFCVGTICLILGTMLCGRVIEATTEEHEFSVSSKGKGRGARVFWFQSARTVGDQHFPAYAIFNGDVNGSQTVRVSRRVDKDYRFLSTCSALLAITGYIVQFVGFRALHWSATVVQLGVTIAITAIRSWVRRGLGEHPIAIPAEEGHELAWLALLLTNEAQDNNSSLSQGPKLTSFWQLISSIMTIGSSPYEEIPERMFKAHPSVPKVAPLCTTLTVLPLAAAKKCLPAEHKTLLTFIEAEKFKIRGTDDKEIVQIAKSLHKVLEQVMDLISQQGPIRWKSPDLARLMSVQEDALSKGNPTLDIVWRFDVGSGQFSEHGLTTILVEPLQLQFRKQHEKSPSDRRKNEKSTWTLLEAEYLTAILSLSACSQAVLDDKPKTSISNNFSRRIVGHTSVEEVQTKVDKLEQWLQNPSLKVEKVAIQEREKDSEHPNTYGWRPPAHFWCLGMFLSSLSRKGQAPDRTVEIAIPDYETTSMSLIWAQELFSIFMLAIASQVEEVLSVDPIHSDEEAIHDDGLFKKIAGLLVDAELATDVETALTLIVPAFIHCGLL